MDTAIVGLLAASIGAAAGLAGAFVTARQQRVLELQRTEVQLVAERQRETRLAVGEFAGDMARAVQAISWFTWEAAHRVDHIGPDWVARYDTEMKQHLPVLMASLSRAAALSSVAFVRFKPLVEKLFDLDAEVAEAAVAVQSDVEAARARIAAFDDETTALFRRFQHELAEWATR